MSTIINPKVLLHPEPVNVDAKIQELQFLFADQLDWLEKAFGRSWKRFEKRDNGKVYTFPAAYSGANSYFNCFPNDTLQAYCFFSHKDKARPVTDLSNAENYLPNQLNEWVHPVDIIFWFNQKKISPDKDYIITENLLADVRKVLRRASFFKPNGVFYDADKIFEGYTISAVEEQYISFPYGGFRIEGEITFLETDAFGNC